MLCPDIHNSWILMQFSKLSRGLVPFIYFEWEISQAFHSFKIEHISMTKEYGYHQCVFYIYNNMQKKANCTHLLAFHINCHNMALCLRYDGVSSEPTYYHLASSWNIIVTSWALIFSLQSFSTSKQWFNDRSARWLLYCGTFKYQISWQAE